jgi:hypothetical protein
MDKKLYKLIKGEMRKNHFANGGTPQDWRGSCSVIPDKVKQHNKEKCRKYVEED